MASCPGPLSVFNAHSMQWMDASSGDSLSRSLSTSIKSEMAAFHNICKAFSCRKPINVSVHEGDIS